jgi:hypothetical protein
MLREGRGGCAALEVGAGVPPPQGPLRRQAGERGTSHGLAGLREERLDLVMEKQGGSVERIRDIIVLSCWLTKSGHVIRFKKI